MEFFTWEQNVLVLTGGDWIGDGADTKHLIKPKHTEPEPIWRKHWKSWEWVCVQDLNQKTSCYSEQGQLLHWFGIALVVGKWGPTVNMALNAKAQCSEQVDRAGQWWNITASPGLWVRADSSPSCGFPITRTCLPPLGFALLVPSRKRSHSPVLCLPLPQVCSRTLCPKEQSCFCFLWLQIQVAVWEWRCPWPSALPRHWGRSWGCYQPSPTWRAARAFPAWEKLNRINFACVNNLSQMRARSWACFLWLCPAVHTGGSNVALSDQSSVAEQDVPVIHMDWDAWISTLVSPTVSPSVGLFSIEMLVDMHGVNPSFQPTLTEAERSHSN